MSELCVAGLIAICIFAGAYHHSYRDKQRWKRISSGMSLFGDREDIPPLVLDGVEFEPHQRNVLVIWADSKQTAFYTMTEAKQAVEREREAGRRRVDGVRVFAWNGETWKQRI